METGRPLPREREWPRLDLANVLWFFGAITAAITSITILDKVPESNADVWLLLASLGFLVAYALASAVLYRRGLSISGGLMATVSAAMVPAVGYAFTQLVASSPSAISAAPSSASESPRRSGHWSPSPSRVSASCSPSSSARRSSACSCSRPPGAPRVTTGR